MVEIVYGFYFVLFVYKKTQLICSVISSAMFVCQCQQSIVRRPTRFIAITPPV